MKPVLYEGHTSQNHSFHKLSIIYKIKRTAQYRFVRYFHNYHIQKGGRALKVIGIIAEYNPFHNGHLYHINRSVSMTKTKNVVVIMSGNFVQRGECAIIDKHLRAKTAVQNGASLVLELPTLYATQSADLFAKGAVDILNSLGIIDYLSFGSESGNLESLSSVASFIHEEPHEYKILLKSYLKEGLSFPRARSRALEVLTGIGSISTPNDVLGVEYLKHLLRSSSGIKPILVPRKGAGHNDTQIHEGLSSATSIRDYLEQMSKEFCGISPLSSLEILSSIPPSTLDALLYSHANYRWMNTDVFLPDIKTIILREMQEIKRYFEVSEGLENRIYENFLDSVSLEDICMKIKTKRYTLTRIRHILLNILLNITKDTMKRLISSEDVGYARILAFDETGRKLLKKCNPRLPLINKASSFRPENEKQELLWKSDHIADTLYYSRYDSPFSNSFVLSPVFVAKRSE